jgi:hypothetical protein
MCTARAPHTETHYFDPANSDALPGCQDLRKLKCLSVTCSCYADIGQTTHGSWFARGRLASRNPVKAKLTELHMQQ